MSMSVRCPVCGHAAKDNASPDPRWGKIYDGRELDRALEASSDDDPVETYAFNDDEGRDTFECACGKAIWIADRQTTEGRWFVAP
jgi:hypothetical protein